MLAPAKFVFTFSILNLSAKQNLTRQGFITAAWFGKCTLQNTARPQKSFCVIVRCPTLQPYLSPTYSYYASEVYGLYTTQGRVWSVDTRNDTKNKVRKFWEHFHEAGLKIMEVDGRFFQLLKYENNTKLFCLPETVVSCLCTQEKRISIF